MKVDFNIIGAGLAGSEAALVLARAGARVRVFEQKPKQFSAVHKLPGAAELVCSNSFKSLEVTSAHGLLKEELRLLDSPLLKFAHDARVPGGKALTVDREKLSSLVTNALETSLNIEVIHEEVTEIPSDVPSLLASGPLTSEALIRKLMHALGDEGLYFYDATSPIVRLDSLDQSKFFWGNRNQEGDDYLNLPLTAEQYREFRDDVMAAEKMGSHHPDEDLQFFEGCLPIEELAARGDDTLAFSCMRPIGFKPLGWPKRPKAIIQFRRERAAGELMNMVGFQTRMKWPEQERVFRALPGMENAEFARLGAMHRNTFINAPLHLDDDLRLKKIPHLFLAGQITGGEGYSEALATGHYAALSMLQIPRLPEVTAIRSLVRYLILSDPQNFQPMNFNFGLLPADDNQERDKKARFGARATRSLRALEAWKADLRPKQALA